MFQGGKSFAWDVQLMAINDYSYKQKKEEAFTFSFLPSLD